MEEVTLVDGATAPYLEEEVTCRGEGTTCDGEEAAEEQNVEVAGSVEEAEEHNVEVTGIVGAAEEQDVEVTGIGDEKLDPVDAENEHEELASHLFADDESDHEDEVLYLVGAQSGIFDLPHNGCACVCVYGGRHNARVCGIPGNVVGKIRLRTSCRCGPSDGLLPGLSWLRCSEGSDSLQLC